LHYPSPTPGAFIIKERRAEEVSSHHFSGKEFNFLDRLENRIFRIPHQDAFIALETERFYFKSGVGATALQNFHSPLLDKQTFRAILAPALTTLYSMRRIRSWPGQRAGDISNAEARHYLIAPIVHNRLESTGPPKSETTFLLHGSSNNSQIFAPVYSWLRGRNKSLEAVFY
jgi:hypothetical protein